MENAFDEMRRAVAMARDVNRAVDVQVDTLLDLLDGRLRKATPWKLKKLKAVLRNFNSQTQRWKD